MKIDVNKVKIILAEKRMTLSALAVGCGISRQSISTIMARGTCSIPNAGKISDALVVDLEEIVKEE